MRTIRGLLTDTSHTHINVFIVCMFVSAYEIYPARVRSRTIQNKRKIPTTSRWTLIFRIAAQTVIFREKKTIWFFIGLNLPKSRWGGLP